MRPSSVFSLLLCATLLPACLDLEPGVIADDELEDVELARDELYSIGSKWPGGWVPVCWAPSTVARADFSTFAQRVRNDAENSWMRVARIEFAGWQTCPANTGGWLVINLITTTTANSNVGYLYDRPTVMNLGVQRGDFDTAVIHEFGHALGFAHEMQRKDFPDIPGTGCVADNVDGGFTHGTDPDPNSIMASTGYCQNGPQLSAWDVVGVQAAYGRKNSGAIVGLNGRCLAINNASTALGASIVGWPCYQTLNGPRNDVFRYNGGGGASLKAFMTGAVRCLAVQNAAVSPSSATPVVSWSCVTPQANESFVPTGVQWRGLGNMCVVATSASSGAQLQLQPCGTMPNERWDVQPDNDYRIKLSGTNLCVNVPWASATLGNLMQLYPCGATPYENESFVFAINQGGLIKYHDLCLSVLGGKPTAGAKIGLWDGCTNVSGSIPRHHMFSWSGPIKSMGQCLDMLGGVSYNGVPIGVFPCVAGAANEQWDIYW